MTPCFPVSPPKVHPPEWYQLIALLVPLFWVLLVYGRWRALAPHGLRLRAERLPGRLPDDLRPLAEAVSNATGMRVVLRRTDGGADLRCCPLRLSEDPLLHLRLHGDGAGTVVTPRALPILLPGILWAIGMMLAWDVCTRPAGMLPLIPLFLVSVLIGTMMYRAQRDQLRRAALAAVAAHLVRDGA